jgi:hypothetical protein
MNTLHSDTISHCTAILNSAVAPVSYQTDPEEVAQPSRMGPSLHHKSSEKYEIFGVLTPVTMRTTVFLDATPYSLVDGYAY